MIFGITYVDHRTKCVFNGSDLGKQYSAKGIQKRCVQPILGEQKSVPETAEKLRPAGQVFRQQTTGLLRGKISNNPDKVLYKKFVKL